MRLNTVLSHSAGASENVASSAAMNKNSRVYLGEEFLYLELLLLLLQFSYPRWQDEAEL